MKPRAPSHGCRVARGAAPAVALAALRCSRCPGGAAQRPCRHRAGSAAGADRRAADAAPRAAGTVPALDEAEALRVSEAAIGRACPTSRCSTARAGRCGCPSYRGKPLLVSFIYTGCFQVCPTQTRALHEAVKGLDRMLGEHQFNVVSIGFNQPFDSPEAMRVVRRAAPHRLPQLGIPEPAARARRAR